MRRNPWDSPEIRVEPVGTPLSAVGTLVRSEWRLLVDGREVGRFSDRESAQAHAARAIQQGRL